VSKLPDSLITNIVTLSGISISSWKKPDLGGKTITPYENENQNENSLTVKL
jgi:hypothetical protein